MTTSLCVLLYDSGTRSPFSSTKCILTTFIIYAVNRCILVFIVALAEFATVSTNDILHHDYVALMLPTVELQSTWSTGSDFVIGKLYANSLLASLNTWQHLRSRGQVKRRHPYRPPHEHTAAFGGNKEFKG
ncbi:hypothetical protein EDD16DRAFT_502482 [Pisolithus croceorrhizus]|nr:hypothetical protein EDD16DRAFT_502482 [Pisolithus croceorrhizus]